MSNIVAREGSGTAGAASLAGNRPRMHSVSSFERDASKPGGRVGDRSIDGHGSPPRTERIGKQDNDRTSILRHRFGGPKKCGSGSSS